MEPASKVSVPLTVVMRTRSSTPDSVFAPPPTALVPDTLPDATEENTHNPVAELCKANVEIPSMEYEIPFCPDIKSPVVLVLLVVLDPHAPLV